MQQLKKMGPLSGLVGMIPGMPKELKGAQIEDDQIARVEAIIRSMTPGERANVDLIDGSRRSRIAKGCGADPGEVSQLVKQFKEMQKMMKRIPGFSGTKKGRGGKGKKGKKGGRPGGTPTPTNTAPKQPFTLPGLS
jgi:signal recognition particle subunit SRP54